MNSEREGNKIKSGKMKVVKGIKNNITLKTNHRERERDRKRKKYEKEQKNKRRKENWQIGLILKIDSFYIFNFVTCDILRYFKLSCVNLGS